MTGLLQAAQHQNGNQIADMQRRGGAVITDIAGNHALGGGGIERGIICALRNKAALVERFEKF
jgi:hypothetical protein